MSKCIIALEVTSWSSTRCAKSRKLYDKENEDCKLIGEANSFQTEVILILYIKKKSKLKL